MELNESRENRRDELPQCDAFIEMKMKRDGNFSPSPSNRPKLEWKHRRISRIVHDKFARFKFTNKYTHSRHVYLLAQYASIWHSDTVELVRRLCGYAQMSAPTTITLNNRPQTIRIKFARITRTTKAITTASHSID